jgi:hypothetical protein
MKANELRIGNLVWEDYGGVYEVLMISPNSVDLIKPLMSVSGRYDLNSIKPIPLTEEWLIKFGFKKHYGERNHLLYSRPGLTLVRYENEFNGYWLKYYHSNKFNNIKHVHQLQNLFIALTGEKLKPNDQS